MPPFGSSPSSRNCGLRKYTVNKVPSARFSLVEPLPRSHSAMCVSSNTIVLPRGLICANPLGNKLPTRQTLAGKALLIWGRRTSGIFAINPPPVLLRSIIRRGAGALVEPCVGESFQRLDQKSYVGLKAAKPAGLFQSFLVHVKRSVDLDLKAVPVHRRSALPFDDFHPLVNLVDADRVAAAAQICSDVVGKFGGAGCSVTIAQDKIRAVPAFPAAALRWHRVAIDMPNDAEFPMHPVASLFKYAMVRDMAALYPRHDFGGRQLAVVNRDARLRDAAHQAKTCPRPV